MNQLPTAHSAENIGLAPPLLPDVAVPPDVVERMGQISAFFLESYRKCGPVFCFHLGKQKFTVLAGPEANAFMSTEGKNYFRAGEFRAPQNEEFGVEKTLLSLNGEEHAQWRRTQKRGYSRSAMNGRLVELITLIQTMVRRYTPGQSIAVGDFMTALVAQQIGLVVMNYAPGEYVEDVVRFVRISISETVAQMPRRLLDGEVYRQAKARSLELADKVLEAHRAAPVSGNEPDVIDDILAALAEGKIRMSEQELRIAVLTPYVGGLDTTANTCAFMLYALLKHPDILARVLVEVDAAFASGLPTLGDLKNMKVLHYAALETLRLYPVSPAIQGVVTEGFDFAGYHIESGANLIVASTVPHFLPELYRDPERFDIERYRDPRNEHLSAGAFSPYGLGEHICLGAGQAEAIIMLTLATLLHAARFELDPVDYRLKIRIVPTPAPDERFHVRLLEHRGV